MRWKGMIPLLRCAMPHPVSTHLHTDKQGHKQTNQVKSKMSILYAGDEELKGVGEILQAIAEKLLKELSACALHAP